MQEENKAKQAKIVFETLCRAMDNREWKYEKDEENLVIRFGARGEDLPVNFRLAVDEDRMLVSLHSLLPFRMAEDKRMEGAIVTSMVNFILVDGSFDYNIDDGAILFRMTSSYLESLLGEGLFEYMIECSMYTVDKYNDLFLMVSKGVMTVEQFKENCL